MISNDKELHGINVFMGKTLLVKSWFTQMKQKILLSPSCGFQYTSFSDSSDSFCLHYNKNVVNIILSVVLRQISAWLDTNKEELCFKSRNNNTLRDIKVVLEYITAMLL